MSRLDVALPPGSLLCELYKKSTPQENAVFWKTSIPLLFINTFSSGSFTAISYSQRLRILKLFTF